MDDSPWLNAKQAATYLGLTLAGLYAHCARGHLPHRRVGPRRMIFNRTELDAFLLGNPKQKKEQPRAAKERRT